MYILRVSGTCLTFKSICIFLVLANSTPRLYYRSVELILWDFRLPRGVAKPITLSRILPFILGWIRVIAGISSDFGNC